VDWRVAMIIGVEEEMIEKLRNSGDADRAVPRERDARCGGQK